MSHIVGFVCIFNKGKRKVVQFMKKMISMVLVIMMGCVLLGGAEMKAGTLETCSIEEDGTIQPLYVDTRKVDVGLSISNGTATGYTSVDTLKKCDISITMKLQKKTGEYWLTIKTWEISKTNALSLEITKNYTIPSGTYRIQSKVVSGEDTITKTSPIKIKN